MNSKNNRISKIRKIYFYRLAGRIAVFAAVLLLYFFDREKFNVVDGTNFFDGFSPLHVLWLLWMWDMLLQLVPVKAHISIGSRKVFRELFRPIKEKINYVKLKSYIKQTTAAAYKVMIIWLLLTSVVSVLYLTQVFDSGMMIVLSTFFYVCDLVCVLIWCPFRLVMKNKCCTTCRIFNWDHLMMFLPIVALNSFYSWSLISTAFIIWCVWEACVLIYPERFWENSNMALKCSECTDKLCTQYCRSIQRECVKESSPKV